MKSNRNNHCCYLFLFSIRNKLCLSLCEQPKTKYANITNPYQTKKTNPPKQNAIGNNSRYKKTVVFDPAKSETYRALQDEQQVYGGARVHEIPITVQHQTYNPHAGKVSTISISPRNIKLKHTQ